MIFDECEYIVARKMRDMPENSPYYLQTYADVFDNQYNNYKYMLEDELDDCKNDDFMKLDSCIDRVLRDSTLNDVEKSDILGRFQRIRFPL